MSEEKKSGIARRAVRAGSWFAVKHLMKPIPVVGTVVAIGLAGYEIKKKGLFKGTVHVALDATPIVGTVKGVVELFTGDLISDKERK